MTVRLDVSENEWRRYNKIWNHSEEEAFLRFTHGNETGP
jgi:hypothetical protein